jgi:hypothetical protein
MFEIYCICNFVIVQKFISLYNNKAIASNEGRIKVLSTTFKLLIGNLTNTHTHENIESSIQDPII